MFAYTTFFGSPASCRRQPLSYLPPMRWCLVHTCQRVDLMRRPSSSTRLPSTRAAILWSGCLPFVVFLLFFYIYFSVLNFFFFFWVDYCLLVLIWFDLVEKTFVAGVRSLILVTPLCFLAVHFLQQPFYDSC
jgi:hypothetical protein